VNANNDSGFGNAAYSRQGRTGLFGYLQSSDSSHTLDGLSLKDNHRTASAAVVFRGLKACRVKLSHFLLFSLSVYQDVYCFWEFVLLVSSHTLKVVSFKVNHWTAFTGL
jgi:hypothetical protein